MVILIWEALASYLVFVRQAALPINQFTQQSNFLLAALAGAERVFKVMDMEPEIDEGKTDLVRVKKENGVLVPCKEKDWSLGMAKERMELLLS